MNGRFYRVTRDLHLYLGLLISPFVLVFSISVFFFVHAWLPKFSQESARTKVIQGLILPEGLQNLSGRPLIEALKPALAKLGVPGEIGFVRHLVKEESFVIPVVIPGRATTVTLNLASREATILTRETGLADAFITLHKAPGQHGPDIRMNWFFMRVWRWLADATVYLILVVSVSGVYLWYVLRSERRIGLILLLTGTFLFFGLAYVLAR